MDLENLIDGVDDITEPACMEKVKMCFEQNQIEDETFMQVLMDRLRGVFINWKQPWYQKSKCLTRPLVVEVEAHEDTFLTETFYRAESELVEQNWRKFVEMYKVPNTPICFARWKNKVKSRNPTCPEEIVRHYVTAFLAQGLQRNLYQVYKHVLTYYGGPVKGIYSDTEEKIMEICFHHCPHNAVTILCSILGREPRHLYRRLSYLYNGKPEKMKVKLNLPLATKLLKLLMKYTGWSLEELRCKKIDKSVWISTQESLGHHYVYLQHFWYKTLHNQLFIQCDVKIKKLVRKVFKLLRTYHYQVWSDIRWKNLLKHFPDGFTHYFLHRVCYNIIRFYPKYRDAPLDVLINYALEKSKTTRNTRLKTLALNENGELEIIKYDVKLKHIMSNGTA